MSDAEDTVDETSSSSEEEEPEIDESQDKFFFKALSCLKNKDPKIYDPNVVFFPEEESKKVKEGNKKNGPESKPVYLRDYERERVLKIMRGEKDDEKDVEEDLPYVEQQKNLKDSFKAALEDSESESEENLLRVKTKTKEDREKEEEDYKAWLKGNKDELDDEETAKDLKPLHDFWSKPELDSNEKFLKDYILNRRYMEEGEEAEDDGISEDGELLEMQEKFETEYNMRFENDTNAESKRYPRVVEGSLRKKDENRKERRKRRTERRKLEKDKKKLEIAKKQKEKLLEFKMHVEKIKSLTGNDQLGFRDEEIFGDEDFDPDAHDKKMEELYSDAFYSADAVDEEKPVFDDDEIIAGPEDLEMEEPGPDNMDLEASSSRCEKQSRSRKKRKDKKKAYTDIMDIAKPVFDPNTHNSYQKYIDEYYGMDCEDFIEDIPCRFKYRETVPNDYGLTVEEILAADDKELNQWVSAKKITKLLPEHVEKNEVKVYKQKAKDYNLKKKILASVYGSPPHEESTDDGQQCSDSINSSNPVNQTETVPSETSTNKKKKKRATEEVKNELLQPEIPKKKKKPNLEQSGFGSNTVTKKIDNNEPNNQRNGTQKNKFRRDKNNKRRGNLNSDPVGQVSDVRLKAYNIKPREFKKKMKFKK